MLQLHSPSTTSTHFLYFHFSLLLATEVADASAVEVLTHTRIKFLVLLLLTDINFDTDMIGLLEYPWLLMTIYPMWICTEGSDRKILDRSLLMHKGNISIKTFFKKSSITRRKITKNKYNFPRSLVSRSIHSCLIRFLECWHLSLCPNLPGSFRRNNNKH